MKTMTQVSPAPREPDHRRLICHIIFKLDYGGLENGVVNLINWMPTERYRHAILCLSHATDFRERIRRPAVPIIEIGKQTGKDPAAYGRVYRALRQLRPWLVHTRNLPAIDMLVPARLAGVRRLVHSEHGLDAVELEGRHQRYNRLRRLSRLLVGHYITMSADLEQWLHAQVGIPTRDLSIVYNGVDIERFAPGARPRHLLPSGFAPDDALVIGTIGRLEPVKDQVTLAQALVRLLQAHPELSRRVRLLVVGDGALRAQMQAVLAAAGLQDHAWLPGFRDDIPDLYRCMDLFVLPSRREGISNTLLEAMASGLPVVATRVGGNPELVLEGLTGDLVPAADPTALAQSLYAILTDPARLAAYGRAGRDRAVAVFSQAAMIRGYMRVYDGLA